MSIFAVYNDDLEEDNDDWNEGDENEDDDDEISSDGMTWTNLSLTKDVNQAI